jgi:uncharacterized protein
MTGGGPSGAQWRPTPFREFVLKVHQRCNLACDYCYLYTMGDTTWRHRPLSMRREIWRAAALRIKEHASSHRLTRVRIVLHGGEPLLVGPVALSTLVGEVRELLEPECDPRFVVQTNATLLDRVALDALVGAGVSVGVSVDGPPSDNDRHRRRANGTGSAAEVERALRLLASPEYRHAFAGLLCTVDPVTDPVRCYEALLAFDPPTIDFLLPHANWDRPPSRPAGDWLVAAFDRWYDVPQQETEVGLFADVLAMLLGGAGRSEQVGLSPVAVAVIDSDGSIEQVDSLRSAYPGACATGLNVLTDSLDLALAHPGIRARQLGVAALSPICRECRLHRVCGGGHYAHRYRTGSGFGNPSVYCADLTHLIDHAARRVNHDLRQRAAERRLPTRDLMRHVARV